MANLIDLLEALDVYRDAANYHYKSIDEVNEMINTGLKILTLDLT